MEFDIIEDGNWLFNASINACGGSGVCGTIFFAAGADKLRAVCSRIGHCAVGSAVINRGYELPAKHVIHALGPVWKVHCKVECIG